MPAGGMVTRPGARWAIVGHPGRSGEVVGLSRARARDGPAWSAPVQCSRMMPTRNHTDRTNARNGIAGMARMQREM